MIVNTIKNITFLGLMHATNYLAPIIIIPALLMKIGIEKYGLVVLAQSIMMIFSSIADFGINISGIRQISQARGDQKKLTKIIATILLSKAMLLLLSIILFIIITLLIPELRNQFIHYFLSFSIVVSSAFLPVWYYQGIEKMHGLTLVNFLSKLIYVACVFAVLPAEDDAYIWVNFYNGVSLFFVSLFFLILIIHNNKIKVNDFSIKASFNLIFNNKSIFLAEIINSFSRASSMLIAGSLFSSFNLGIFSIIDKIVMLMRQLSGVVYQGLFPTAALLALQSTQKLKAYLKKTTTTFLFLSIVSGILLFTIGPWLVSLVEAKISINQISEYLVFLSIIPCLFILNAICSMTLVALNMQGKYAYFHMIALVLYLLLGYSLGYLFGVWGMLVTILITEIIVITFGYSVLFKSGFKPVVSHA